MRITEVHGYIDEEDYTIEFKAGGQFFLLRNPAEETRPAMGHQIDAVGTGNVYRIAETGRMYRVVWISRLTDLTLLEGMVWSPV